MDFNYKARNAQGAVQTGIVKASDDSAALEILQKNKLDVFYLEEATAKGFMAKITQALNRVSAKQVMVFSRQLSVMIESSVPIMKALRTIATQTENPALAQICKNMANYVEEGEPFSEALARYPKEFDQFYVSVIKSGEASGNLKRSLTYLADHLEKAYELKRKIQGALMYPGFILLAFTGIFFFLTIYVLPELTSILKDSGVTLPWTTQIVIFISDFMEKYWIFVLIALMGGIGGFIVAIKTSEGKSKFDEFTLKIPIIGNLIKNSYVARFSENLRVLLEEGVSIINALGILSEVMGNAVYEKLLVKVMKNVEKGKSMADALMEDTEAFPIMVPQMIKIGEEAGRTPQILKNIESFYTREVNTMADNMTSVIEPVLIVVLGLGTGILVAAIIMPIYDMAGAL